jgi:hypothetical protein
LANAWKETVRDAVADIRAHREAAKATVRRRVGRGEERQPVGDLQPYLGAYGHLVAFHATDLRYLRVHPQGGPGDGITTPGPRIFFAVEVPTAGRYRLFLDLQHDGTVRTADFTVDATGAPAGDAPGAGHTEHGS